MNDFTLLITGLGRCGTSLSMQLLEAAGYPCHGEYPAYEPDDVNPDADLYSWYLQQLKGKAVKMLLIKDMMPWDTFDFTECRVIYLKRDTDAQARSQIKMASVFTGTAPKMSRRNIRRVAAELKRENRYFRRLFKDLPVLDAKFENLISDPAGFIDAVEFFTGTTLSKDKAETVRIARDAGNYNGLLEADLLERGKP